MNQSVRPHNMTNNPLVSIVVNNYNYGRFLSAAIDSTLAQTYANVEVIVVDDGSSDNSRTIIDSYGDRISPVLKTNGGQGSAVNAGFAESHGEIVIFLDADDMLLPNIAERVAEGFAANPELTLVQYKLAAVDAAGEPMGMVIPPPYIRRPNEDLRGNVQHIYNNTWWTNMSGNAFASWSLQRILPIPEHVFKYSADHYLSRATAFVGPVRSLEEVGAYYRVHGSNNFYNVSNVDPQRIRLRIRRIAAGYACLKDRAEALGVEGHPDRLHDILDIMFLSERMVSLKLDPLQHPIKEDSLWSLFWWGSRAALSRPDVALPHKLLHTVWFALMFLAPKFLAPWLTEQLFYPHTRGRLKTVLALMTFRK